MAVYLLVVLERNKQLSVVPITSVLSFSHASEGSNVDFLSSLILSAPPPSCLPEFQPHFSPV